MQEATRENNFILKGLLKSNIATIFLLNWYILVEVKATSS